MKKQFLFLYIISTIFAFANDTFTLQTIDDNNITVNTQNGKMVFNEYNDSVVILLFFGHNCKPCLHEIPTLKKLMDKKYKDLKLLAFDIHGYDKNDLEKFKKEHKINYNLLTRKENMKFIKLIKVKAKWRGSLPFIVVFDKKGEPKLAHRGSLSFAKFEKIYEALKHL